jgi:hypothetical protein
MQEWLLAPVTRLDKFRTGHHDETSNKRRRTIGFSRREDS